MSRQRLSDVEHAGKRRQSRREAFLPEMEGVPWKALLAAVGPHYPKAGR